SGSTSSDLLNFNIAKQGKLPLVTRLSTIGWQTGGPVTPRDLTGGFGFLSKRKESPNPSLQGGLYGRPTPDTRANRNPVLKAKTGKKPKKQQSAVFESTVFVFAQNKNSKNSKTVIAEPTVVIAFLRINTKNSNPTGQYFRLSVWGCFVLP